MTNASTARISHFTRSQLVATFAAGCAALLITGVQPVALGALIDAGIVDLRGAGRLVSIEAFALAAGIVAATAMLPATALRKVGLWCSLGLCAVNLATAATDSYQIIAVLRTSAGLMGGALLWVVTSVIVRTPRPERLAGFFMAGYTTFQAMVVLLIAVLFVPMLGWKGCYVAIALAVGLSVLLSVKLPSALTPLPSASAKHQLKLSPAIILAGTVIFLQMIMAVTIWAFLEPIGRQTGVGVQDIQLIVSASLVVQVLGAASAGFLASRLHAAATLLVLSLIVLGIAAYILNIAQFSSSLFMPGAFLFSFVWMFILPFQTRLSLDIEPTGRFALTVPFLQLLAGAVAPITAGELAGDGMASDVAFLSVGSAGVAAVLLAIIIPTIVRGRRSSALGANGKTGPLGL